MNMQQWASRCAKTIINGAHIRFRDNAALRTHLASLDGVAHEIIGQSRDGQDIFGMRFGCGAQRVSILAGSHADEPTGPMTAQALPVLLARHFPELLEQFHFCVVPQINPDGADRNRAWFDNPPDFVRYTQHAQREPPGDDIEFGFGDAPGARPENKGAMTFWRPHAPFAAHFSLHGMAWAEGAWCLICKQWAEHAGALMNAIESVLAARDFPLHDIDRKGAKGFTRLRPGFATTPTAMAMRAYFKHTGDPETAQKFRPSSMEYATAMGGNPLCAVTEMPLFRLTRGETSLNDPILLRFRDAVQDAQAQGTGTVEALGRQYGVTPVPLDFQMQIQLSIIVLSLASAIR